MNCKFRLIFFLFAIVLLPLSVKSQTIINGIINTYTKVTSIDADNLITVNDVSGFKAGDTVLLIQMKGTTIFTTAADRDYNTIIEMKGTGRYEFIVISLVNTGTKQVEFGSYLINHNSDVALSHYNFEASENLQLIRVPSYKSAKVQGNVLTCKPWDGSSGGVLAMIVNDTLTLNDSIDVSNKGFRGGLITTSSSINCPTGSGFPDYDETKADSAGRKGEGLISNTFTYTRGYSAAVNAGGGGYRRYAGGGGGANFGNGGLGGRMDNSCTDPNPAYYFGGHPGSISPNYMGDTINPEYRNRVFMGGGGGTGSQSAASYGTSGGAGGGIVFIIARNFNPNGKKIISNGESIAATATNNASAGGGGAGGSIILSVDNYLTNLNLVAHGGHGGNTSGYCFGQGGGGGGGFVWYSGQSVPVSSSDLTGGGQGIRVGFSCTDLQTTGGFPGGTAKGLNVVLNGFLFNIIGKTQTICYNEKPQKLVGSNPHGGDGNFKYQWQKHTNSTTWSNIAGATSRDYQPSNLTDTTYYKRIVKVYRPEWHDTVTDIGNIIVVNVIPDILNNSIAPDTAVCYGLPAVVIRGKKATGGDNSFTYNWQYKDASSAWTDASSSNTQNFTANTNIKTQYYRRIVTSNICKDTSNVDTVLIYPLITNDSIKSSQTICYNYLPKTITGTVPQNGKSGNYTYKWEKSENDRALWTDMGVSTQNYSPGKLTKRTYFRRIVFSGLNNTCKDTANYLANKWVRIDTTSSITSNTIQASQTICEATSPASFTGSSAGGGNGSYSYQWEKSTNGTVWDSITTSNTAGFQSPALLSTTYFRRIVRSGINDCCKDTTKGAAIITVTIQPKIQNNVIADSQEICNGQVPALLKQKSGTVSGGDGSTYNYSWEQKTTGNWSNINGASLSSYQSVSLSLTTYFRRKIISGTCFNYSDSLKINVLPLISGNTISGSPEVCFGLIPDPINSSGQLSGGNNIYKYSWQDSIANGTWNTITDSTRQNYYPPVIPQDKYFRRIIKSGINDCCISISAPFGIKVNPLPIGILQNLDTAICNGKNIELKINLTGNEPFDVVLNDGTNDFSQSGINSGMQGIVIQPQLSNQLQIKSITDVKGCIATNKTGSATVRLVAVPVANAGSGGKTCGLNYNLNAVPSIGTGEWIADEDAIFDPSRNQSNASISFITYGLHTLYWKESNEFCSDSSAITITTYQQPEKPDAGPDQELAFTFETALNGSIPIAGNVLWNTTNDKISIQSPEANTTSASGLTFGKNIFVYTVTNGVCPSVSDSVTIDVNDLKTYTGFSPNGDGQNDVFIIDGLDNAASKKIVILNRWGGTVFSSDNYQNNWDGNNNEGKPLPSDTYFYILTVDGNRAYKGFIVLKR